MKIKTFIILTFCLLFQAFASEKTQKDDRVLIFTKGDGAKYKMSVPGKGSAELSISISESSFDRLGIEYFMSAGDQVASAKLWQQFIMERPKNSPIKIVEGYIFAEDLTSAQKLDAVYLKGYDGVQMSDFLFKERSEIDKDKIADEMIEVPAGNTMCSHYRKNKNGQTVDFWISKDAGAIGLVKLVSKSEKNVDQNYSVELLNLLKNVAPTINPKNAVPLDAKGKALMPIPITK